MKVNSIRSFASLRMTFFIARDDIFGSVPDDTVCNMFMSFIRVTGYGSQLISCCYQHLSGTFHRIDTHGILDRCKLSFSYYLKRQTAAHHPYEIK